MIASAGSSTVIFPFRVVSTVDHTFDGTFSSQATNNARDATGSTDQTVGGVTVPAPEPGNLLLLAPGLMALAVFGRRGRA